MVGIVISSSFQEKLKSQNLMKKKFLEVVDLLHWASCSLFYCNCSHRTILASLLPRFVLAIPQQSNAKPLAGGALVPRFDNLFQISGLFGCVLAAGFDNSF